MTLAGDRILRELDVFVSGTLADAGGHQVYLIQYPLRPAWRPYNMDAVDQVEVKSQAQKLLIKTLLDTKGPNFNPDARPSQKVESLVLESSVTTPEGTFAAAIIQGDQAVLLPVQAAWQMRPKMSYLDPPATALAKDKPAQSVADPDELTPVQTQLRKRETDRQKEQRLASYQHLRATEDAEPWKALSFEGADGNKARAALASLGDTRRLIRPLCMDMARSSYAEALLPGEQLPGPRLANQSQLLGPARLQVLPAPRGGAPLAHGSSHNAQQGAAGPVPAAGALAALPAAVAALFSQHSVATLDNVREWLLDGDGAGAARGVAVMEDDSLHQAIMACDGVMCIRSSYLKRHAGTSQQYRNLLLDILSAQESVKRAEIIAAAQQRNMQLSESDYSRHMVKVMKELCTSSGSNWHLKQGW